MAEKTEVDMDVFSRRISPYFTWLESRIESGWKQSESCRKDILKETRTMATNMRAKFILGVSNAEFKQELANTVELFELAIDAFPDYAGEVENKLEHFSKGIRTEIGEDMLPNGNGIKIEQMMPEPKIVKEVKKPARVKKVAKAKKEPAKIEEAVPKVKKAVKKKTVKKAKKKAVKKAVEKIEDKAAEKVAEIEKKAMTDEKKVEPEQAKTASPQPKAEPKPRKPNAVIKWLRNAIFGDDLD